MDDEMLIIYKTKDILELNQINNEVNELKTTKGVLIKETSVPAVVGELAGVATQFIMSQDVQSIKNAIEIGMIFSSIINVLKKINKKFMISKKLSKFLALYSLNEKGDIESDEDIVIWGPMLIEPRGNNEFSKKISSYGIDASGECAYLMTVSMPKKSERIKTIWNIIGANGEIMATWETQTFEDKVPDFFKKNVKDKQEEMVELIIRAIDIGLDNYTISKLTHFTEKEINIIRVTKKL